MTIWAVPMCYFTLLTNPKKIALEFPFKNLHELPLNVRPKHTCKSLKATIFTNIQYKWDNLRNTHFIIQSKFYINSIKKKWKEKRKLIWILIEFSKHILVCERFSALVFLQKSAFCCWLLLLFFDVLSHSLWLIHCFTVQATNFGVTEIFSLKGFKGS